MAFRPQASPEPTFGEHRSPVDRARRALRRAPLPRPRGSTITLRYSGRWSGSAAEVHAAYAADPTGRLVVRPAGAGAGENAVWWLDLADPTRVRVLLDGVEHGGLAFVADPGSASHKAAVAAYHGRFPTESSDRTDPLVLVDLDPERPSGRPERHTRKRLLAD